MNEYELGKDIQEIKERLKRLEERSGEPKGVSTRPHDRESSGDRSDRARIRNGNGGLPELPDPDVSVTIVSPANLDVVPPARQPLKIQGSTTSTEWRVERVEVRLGAEGQFQPATPAQPGNWSTWSFTGMPASTGGPTSITARATATYYWRGLKRLSSEAQIDVVLTGLRRLAVPAYWGLERPLPPNPVFEPHWQALKQAGMAVGITIVEQSWPQTARNNSTWGDQARSHLDTLPGIVLGYVSTRSNFNLLPPAEILGGSQKIDSVQAWYEQFGQQIDGIYFDEIVLPEDPGSVSAAVNLVAQFKQGHPTAKAMILAGQCVDQAVVGPDIDWALLWESHEPSYREDFYPLVLKDPSDTRPINERDTLGKLIPPWWKDPQHRPKIVHVVHGCDELHRQNTLGLANERNAGHVFVMDQRGIDSRGKDSLYNHLPLAYWNVEVREVQSYYDFGFEPVKALLAARRYGMGQGKFHAWPNFEAAWYASGHVRGTFMLDAGPHAMQSDVLQADLLGAPSPFDIPALWGAVHQYAQDHGFETGLPTFEHFLTGNGLAYRVILFARALPWLSYQRVPICLTYQHPTFAEPGAVIRNINRWATSNGHKASFPTFVPDDVNPRGRSAFYNCYVLSNAAPVSWQDVPTSVYIGQL